MTEPTDAELKAMWQLHAADIGGIFYYARAVLAKWGQPAQAAEPVYAFRRKGLDDFCTCTEKRYAELSAKPNLFEIRIFYTAPQPVAREPLTDEQIKALMQAHRTAMLMTCKARVPECGEFAAIAQDLDWLCESFGIKGGQHVS